MNITKQQYEELMEKLSNKNVAMGRKLIVFPLQFGERTQEDIQEEIWVQKGDKYFDNAHDSKIIERGEREYEILYIERSQVLIGDVLEKEEPEFWGKHSMGNMCTQLEMLCIYWSACGFSKSIQAIIEEKGWECEECKGEKETSEHCVMKLKSPEASELISYLYKLLIK